MGRRYEELDSLRGLASASVMFHHLTLVFVSTGIFGVLGKTPIHIFWAGHPAVIFFFVLSGFVLSLPFYSGTNASYGAFITKRFIRIYVPYYVAITIAILFESQFSRHGIPQLAAWFNMMWVSPLTPSLLASHLLLLGNFNNHAFDPVIWSLIYEMRISLIFPIVMLLVQRLNWEISVAVGIVLSIIAFVGNYDMYLVKGYVDYGSSYVDTFHYVLMFIVGALLAKHKDFLVAQFQKQNKWSKGIVLLGGVLFYTYSYWVPQNLHILHIWVLEDWCITIGASIFLVSTLGSTSLSRVMLYKPINFVGKMSYSLYLYHAICILTVFNILYGKVPTWFVVFLSLMCAVGLSIAAYYFVEIPSIAFTRKVRSTRRLTSVNKTT